MDKIYGKIRAAIDKYDMIPENANVAVGVSGGKDSLVLLYCLAKISQYHPRKFTVTAINSVGGKTTETYVYYIKDENDKIEGLF